MRDAIIKLGPNTLCKNTKAQRRISAYYRGFFNTSTKRRGESVLQIMSRAFLQRSTSYCLFTEVVMLRKWRKYCHFDMVPLILLCERDESPDFLTLFNFYHFRLNLLATI